MLLHLLSDQAQKIFLEIAWVFCISDNELLWDGKTQDEITGTTDLSNMSIQVSESEEAILSSFMRECNSASDRIGKEVQKEFIEKIKLIKLSAQSDPSERLKAAKALLEEKIDGAPKGTWSFSTTSKTDAAVLTSWGFPSPSVKAERKTSIAAYPKVMLFEVMLLCLADGKISGVEQELLQEFSQLVHVESFVFDDLLECAKSMNHETLKTLAIILE